MLGGVVRQVMDRTSGVVRSIAQTTATAGVLRFAVMSDAQADRVVYI